MRQLWQHSILQMETQEVGETQWWKEKRVEKNGMWSEKNRGLIYKNVFRFRLELRLKIMSYCVLIFDSQKMLSIKKNRIPFITCAPGIYKSQMNLNWRHLPCNFNASTNESLVRNNHRAKEKVKHFRSRADSSGRLKPISTSHSVWLNSGLTNEAKRTVWECVTLQWAKWGGKTELCLILKINKKRWGDGELPKIMTVGLLIAHTFNW